MSGEHEDPHQARVRDHLEAMRQRSEKAQSWRNQAGFYTSLLNRQGYVTVRAQLSRADLAFLTMAREDVMSLADVALRLLELHRPRDAGGITSDPSNPIRRCRSCMWRWPCPTFRAFSDALGGEA
ncbi:MAG TPA: hypothetical protein VGL93_34225 [Streptosporangiaceae bacterium]|jgi:hypothetical protein